MHTRARREKSSLCAILCDLRVEDRATATRNRKTGLILALNSGREVKISWTLFTIAVISR